MIGVICKGNILRSQVMHQYLVRALLELNCDIEIFSCGISEALYQNELLLLNNVENQLKIRGVNVKLKRNKWNQEIVKKVCDSTLILIADSEIKAEVILKTGISSSKLFLFYEFINEGKRDFYDTYNYSENKQDARLFYKSFDELKRIAFLSAKKILELN